MNEPIVDDYWEWAPHWWVYKWEILSPLGWGLLEKPKAKPRKLILKVDNIIPLWRSVISNMVSESCPKLSHINRILKYQTKNCDPRRCNQKWLKCRTNDVFCSRAPEKGVEPRLRGGLLRRKRRRASIKESIVKDYWEWYYLHWDEDFCEAQSKAMRVYAQSGQYHTIVKIRDF